MSSAKSAAPALYFDHNGELDTSRYIELAKASRNHAIRTSIISAAKYVSQKFVAAIPQAKSPIAEKSLQH